MNKLVEPLQNNTLLAEYQVIKHLGQGGFGTTYLCTDRNLDRRCVIKEYSPHYLVKRMRNGEIQEKEWRYHDVFDKGKKAFLTEARSLAKFNHHNIARISRYFEANNTAYFVMDYESGTSLRDILCRNNNQFEEQEIEAIVAPLCDGLEQLHKMGLIHRDIKPDNILIRSNGEPVLIDFGAVIDLNDKDIEIIATPSYAPIEQYDSRFPQGPWIDIYALAATMYEMIAGSPPPPAMERLVNDSLSPAKKVGRGKYGDRLLGLIDMGLAIDPTERPRDIGEFVSLLKLDDRKYLKGIIIGLSEKTIQHFLNWASPNDGLYVDEFVSFCICFPIIDISWRLGKGSPTKELYLSLYQSLDYDVLEQCRSLVLKSGFTNHKRNLTLKTVESRMDEYSATYLLDRQAELWTYEQTRRQCARNCLAANPGEDIEGFMGLMEDVIDRCRGRVKKEFEKAFRKVEWIHTSTGWKKEIRSFD
jgi:serine/threonine protein kinase